jgi:predicted metalloprotease
MVATVDDLVAWWGDEMPRVFGQDYAPLEGGVFPAYPERTDYPQPGCFDTYADIEGNGYYCSVGDYIVWDDTNYALPGYEDHGSGAITGLMSHEWGHAIQQRTGVFDIVPELPTIITELQADCYSGAWFGHIARGESDLLSFTDADIRSGLLDTALSADPVGTTPDIDGAHGAGFDRVAAFQDGFERGSEQCATYAETPPPVTEIGFSEDEALADDPGDLPYADLIDIVPTDLNVFWASTVPGFADLTLVPFTGDVPTCGSVDMAANTNPLALYCADEATVYVAEVGAQQALDQIGDFGPIYLLATAWGDAAQTALGSTIDGEQRVLYNDCLVGVWAGSLPTTDEEATAAGRDLLISAGDLDEAVATAIALGDDDAGDDVRGDAFAKVDAFRTGVLDGIDGCSVEYGS